MNISPVTIADVQFFMENYFGGSVYMMRNYTIVDSADGIRVECLGETTPILTDSNFERAILALSNDVESLLEEV